MERLAGPHERNVHMFIIEAWFRNAPVSPISSAIARNVTATVEIRKPDGKRLAVIGLWIMSSAPTNISIDHAATEIDIHPNDIPAKLGIAVKHQADSIHKTVDTAYAVVQETQYRDFVHPDFTIQPGIHDVAVNINGVGVRERFMFTLINFEDADLGLTRAN
jgi:hypothetical protein